MNFEKEQQAILAKAKELHVEATSLGSDQAPVLFVHDRIRLYEKLPFTSTQDNRQCLPYVNSRVMGVNPATIRMTDLRRLPGDQRPLSFWVQYLMAEITVLPVRAVILLGEKVANQFFQTLLNEETDEIENKIDALRRKRFMVPECDVSFFVAHDLKDIFAGPELTPLGFQWLEDVRAVFDSDVTYFKTEVLSATRKKMTELNAPEAKLALGFLEKPLKKLCKQDTRAHDNGLWLTNDLGTTYAILMLEPPHLQSGLSRLRFTNNGDPFHSLKGAVWLVLFEPMADRYHMVLYEEFRLAMKSKINPDYMSVRQDAAGVTVIMHLDWAKGTKLIKHTEQLGKGTFQGFRDEKLRESERFVHLHNHSTFSLLDGASSIPGIAQRAYLNGQPGIALTDHGNCFGAYKHWEACRDRGIKALMGCEIYLVDDVNKKYTDESGTVRRFEHHLTLIASDQTGWANLSKMLTKGGKDYYYYVPRIDYAMLREFNAGIICLTGCFKGPVAHYLQTQTKKDSETVLPWWRQRNVDLAVKNLKTLQDIYGDRLYGECMNIEFAQYSAIVSELMGIFDHHNVPKVLSNDNHYEVAEDAELQAMMTLISKQKVDDVGGQIKRTGELFIRDTNELTAGAPWVTKDMLERTVEVMDRCSLTFERKGYLFPPVNKESFSGWKTFVANGKKAIVPPPGVRHSNRNQPVASHTVVAVATASPISIDPRTLARTNDPDTGHESARRKAPKINDDVLQAVEFVRMSPGCTASELDETYCPGKGGKIHKRLKNAADEGLIVRGAKRPCRISGARALVCYTPEAAPPGFIAEEDDN